MEFTGQITVHSHHMAPVTDKHPAGPVKGIYEHSVTEHTDQDPAPLCPLEEPFIVSFVDLQLREASSLSPRPFPLPFSFCRASLIPPGPSPPLAEELAQPKCSNTTEAWLREVVADPKTHTCLHSSSMNVGLKQILSWSGLQQGALNMLPAPLGAAPRTGALSP